MTQTYNQKIDAIDPEVLVTLNKMFEELLPDMEKHLNTGVINVQLSEGHWLIPSLDVAPGKPTIAVGDETAFILNEPGVVSVSFEKEPMNQVVLRYKFDFETVVFAIKSKNAFDVAVGPVVKDMIDELRGIKGYNEFGFSYGNVYGTFKRPGSDLVFKELEAGGVELRLYSDSARLGQAKQKAMEQEKFLARTHKEGLKSV